MIKNIVYKRNEKLRYCSRCSIILVPEGGSVSYWYGNGDSVGHKELIRLVANKNNAWNGKSHFCNYCLKVIYGKKKNKVKST